MFWCSALFTLFTSQILLERLPLVPVQELMRQIELTQVKLRKIYRAAAKSWLAVLAVMLVCLQGLELSEIKHDVVRLVKPDDGRRPVFLEGVVTIN